MEKELFFDKSPGMGRMKKQKTEITLVREYLVLKARLDMINYYATDPIIVSRTDVHNKIQPFKNLMLRTEKEVVRKFIAPKLENKSEHNFKANFKDLLEGWEDFFANMSEEERDKFFELEKRYIEREFCPEYENIQLPKKYRKDITDLTDEEWQKKIKSPKKAKLKTSLQPKNQEQTKTTKE